MPWMSLLKANIRKEFIELKRYLPNMIAMLFTFYILFLGMFAGIQFIGDPSNQDMNTQYVIVNYLFWFLSLSIMNSIGFEVVNEAMRGTLEQLAMSPLGMWRIMLTRLIATTLIQLVLIGGLLYAAMLTSGQWLNLDLLTILPILLLTLISMYGIGFMIAGISILLKQVQAFLQIFQFLLVGLTFIPLSVAPFLVFFPFVKGIDLVREVMINGIKLTDIGFGDYLILGANAAVYFPLGLAVFLYCEKVAMQKGLLAHY